MTNKQEELNSQLKSVSDEEGNTLYWDIRLAANNPETAPILICFYGWGGNSGGFEAESNWYTRYPNWNVVKPLDRFGYRKNGSWYLGENCNFFLLKLIEKMVDEIRNQYNLAGDLFTYGSSMGGFGALIHGLRLKVNAIAVNVPQVRLIGTHYLRRNESTKKILESIFGTELSYFSYEEVLQSLAIGENPELIYSDATLLLNKDNPEKNPVFFISQTRFDSPGENLYFKEHCLHLIQKLVDLGCNFELFVEPKAGHYTIRSAAQAIELFEKYSEVIYSPLCY